MFLYTSFLVRGGISVHSCYLTSFVILSFYRMDFLQLIFHRASSFLFFILSFIYIFNA